MNTHVTSCMRPIIYICIYILKAIISSLYVDERARIRLDIYIHTHIYIYAYIWHSPGHPHPPPPGDGHGSLPRPLWEWVGWLWMGGNVG